MHKYNLKISKIQGMQSGITLVALVITVVVMLILAGVAIAAVVDGDGLFSKTREATKVYENAADKESEMLTNLMGQIDHYLDENKDGGKEPVENQPIVNPINQIVPVNQTYSGGTTGTYNDPIIPKGFAPINENGATWGSENGYQYGLVITDEVDGDGNSTGNEFVWIPVDGTIVKFERQDFGFYWDGNFGDYSDPETQELINIRTSVNNNGGFYIARFEAGIAENMPQEELSSDSSATYGTGTYKPVSKQGAIVWNCIQWGDENNDATPGNGVVTVSRNMYPEEDPSYGVVSTLIYGTQWDTALKFIGEYGGDTEYAIDSTGKGNYSGTKAISGEKEEYRQKNVYDLAGNVYEWTMERYSTGHVGRGGYFRKFRLRRSRFVSR